MAPTKELQKIIRRALDVPRVVGAGIGARPRRDIAGSPCEPVLTIMVEKGIPGDEARVVSALGGIVGRPVEVMEVGRVASLLLERPKA